MFSIFSQFIFGNSGFFGSHGQSSGYKSSSWKDKSLCFDLRTQDLLLDAGEQLIGCFFPIEDVKGNQDELGVLKVTNLRLIWICCKKKRTNLSIGWRTVLLCYEHNLKDGLGGTSSSLFVLTKYETTKYEFIFNRQSAQNDIWSEGGQENWNAMAQLRKFSQDKAALISHLSPMYIIEPFEVIFKVWQSYKQTHLFRHCRSNLANLLTKNSSQDSSLDLRHLNKLPNENVIETISGIVQSESKTTKYMGTLMLTNVRLIWIDETLPMRNLSIPYIRIDSLKLKQAEKMVVTTQDYLTSSTHVEFKVQKTSSEGTARVTRMIMDQIQNLYSLYKSKPRYGPESCDDCINFMGHLKPIEHYFESINESFVKALENLGPELNRSLGDRSTNDLFTDESHPLGQARSASDMALDDNSVEIENDLDKYSKKLDEYLNEHPIDRDNDLVYSKALGLTIERPTNGLDLKRIWRIDI